MGQMDTQFISNILDRIPGMIVLYNLQTGEYRYVNKSIKKLLGYTADTVLSGGFSFTDTLIHPDDLQVIIAQNQKAMSEANKNKPTREETAPIATLEYRIKHKNGSWRWLHTDGMVFDRDTKGNVLHVVNISIDITARREAELREAHARKVFEQKLLQSERRYRSLIENSFEVVSITDKEGKFIYASPSIKRVLGFTPKEILGMNTLDLFPPQFREEELKKFGDISKTPGKSVRVVSRYQNKKGKMIFVESTVTNLLHDPFIQGFVSNFRDITKEKQAMETERHMAAIVASSDDAIVSKTLDGIIRTWNKSAQNIFGYTAKEAIGKHITLLIPPELRTEEANIISTIKKGGHIDHFETTRVTKSGRRIVVSLSISPIKDHEGNIMGASKIARDITQKKKYEEVIARSQERLQLAIDAGRIGIWDWDIVNNKILWTDRVYEIHGVRKGSAIGELERYSQHHHPEDAARVKTAIEQALKGTKPYKEEFRIITPQGKVRWVETRANVIRDQDGKPIRMLGATTDITERKNLEQQKDEFIGIASHELKTPVTSIKAYTQLLESKFRKEGYEQPAMLLTKANSQLDKLTGLISDLLDVTRIETGKLEYHEGIFDFNEMVKETVDQIQLTSPKHTINTTLAPTRKVYGDRDRIGQVLTNFLTNAVKYSPQADKIHVTTSQSNDEISVSVRDYGIGIREDVKDKVFERFFRVETLSGQTFPGMGLGLYISSQIIQSQRGRIWVKSTPGKGSTFSFSLPVRHRG